MFNNTFSTSSISLKIYTIFTCQVSHASSTIHIWIQMTYIILIVDSLFSFDQVAKRLQKYLKTETYQICIPNRECSSTKFVFSFMHVRVGPRESTNCDRRVAFEEGYQGESQEALTFWSVSNFDVPFVPPWPIKSRDVLFTFLMSSSAFIFHDRSCNIHATAVLSA